jgi:cytochrome c oxidase subunit 2
VAPRPGDHGGDGDRSRLLVHDLHLPCDLRACRGRLDLCGPQVWTAVPAVLVTSIALYSSITLIDLEDIPADHRVVKVTSQQFAWSFSYPDLKTTKGELVLERGKPVELELTSKDVIHSFWVPEFRMKQDAVPGVTTHLVITPDRTGTFDVVCTELCGLGHAGMRARAVVLDRQKYARWVEEQKAAL